MVDIISRSAWGANPLNTPAGVIATPCPELWLHHTGSTGLHGASGMQSLQAGALSGGYVDLEYTYVADTDGKAFMSRGPGRNTAATSDHNDRSAAICAMGNYETQYPTDELLNVIVELAVSLYEGRSIAQPAITGPHRDASGNATACCGRNLIAHIDELNAQIRAGKPSPGPEPAKGGAVDMFPTPSGKGYWIVDSTGAIFAYGDAPYYGGANNQKLVAPIVSMAARPQGDGYWLLGADGGIFAYGKAPFKGSMGGKKLNAPMVAIAAADDGAGYWTLGADGGVFAFGSAPFKGAATGLVST